MNSIFDKLPSTAFWRPSVAEAGPFGLSGVVQTKFTIKRETKVATAGSCFAQHVGRSLRRAGINVLDVEPAPPGLDVKAANSFGFGLFSARYGNIYTTGQLRQLLEDVRDNNVREECVWNRDGRFFDGIRPGVEPFGSESEVEVLAIRRFHLSRLRELFTETELFIFTLGLTECWKDLQTGTIFPVAPGVICEPSSNQNVVFHNHNFSEVSNDLEVIKDVLCQFNSAVQIILTVSPVPLTATCSDRHVLVASTASKSILRAAVDGFVACHPKVDYVPSYEIITNPAVRGQFYATNLRDIDRSGVDLVMSLFLGAHGLDELAGDLRASEVFSIDTVEEIESVICEEALAEAFLK